MLLLSISCVCLPRLRPSSRFSPSSSPKVRLRPRPSPRPNPRPRLSPTSSPRPSPSPRLRPRLRPRSFFRYFHVSVLQLFDRTQLVSENRRHKDQQAAQLFKCIDHQFADVLDLFISSTQFLDRVDDIIVLIELSSKSKNGCTICHYLHHCGFAHETSYLILNRNDPIG